jgi:UDP-N-acetyl-D-mannosaminuronic acid transferase (WecB/TagA/CpsF family)
VNATPAPDPGTDLDPAPFIPIAILGIPIDAVRPAQAVDLAMRAIASRRAHYVLTTEAAGVLQARQDEELRQVLFGSDLVLTGDPLLTRAARLLGNPIPPVLPVK